MLKYRHIKIFISVHLDFNKPCLILNKLIPYGCFSVVMTIVRCVLRYVC